ncbi:AbrB/MazE/SpoVT family DNA-binding domain-containing protein [Oenococcus sicerae]|uniref:AbrB/MazE/SpoVT family DNA-binding domain-containing protein n=1 Tax=Oenococcus sicerae TaxID=2203724 RepID=A0AAJ1R7W6_9LACO|nr:AbrB/MazE/SpoVT family DNA-binding domain-containing protein [Oenococcus sicerae]MDN6899658.1 AbrB/MazE/SpoVT family DNA-binding domain-containing protein [Oenococcus sicerae]
MTQKTNVISETKIAQWGHSKATRIPTEIIKELNLKDDQKLLLTVKNNSIILTPIQQRPTNIHELFDGWQDDGNKDRELDWREAKGNELQW